MENKPKMSPKDFFLHIGIIVALYAVVISFLNLAFSLIDALYPQVGGYYYYSSPISWPVAMLIVLFPLYIFLSWLASKDFARDPEKKNLGVRRWLVYLTLFVAGLVIAGDLIAVLYKFLDGNILTASFLWKALSVFIVTLAVFGYYISDLRGKITASKNKTYALIALVAVVALIMGGFAVLGSPLTQRQVNYDNQKINDLQGIQSQVVNFWQNKNKLPGTLSELNDPLFGFIVPVDSQTGEAYQYQKVSDLAFKLCAVFNREALSTNVTSRLTKPVPAPGGYVNEVWQHPAGEYCFDRTVDPDQFPPRKI